MDPDSRLRSAGAGTKWCAPPHPPSAVAIWGRHVLGAPDGSAAGTDTWPWAVLPRVGQPGWSRTWTRCARGRPPPHAAVATRGGPQGRGRGRPVVQVGSRCGSGAGAGWGGGKATLLPPGVAHFLAVRIPVPRPNPGPSSLRVPLEPPRGPPGSRWLCRQEVSQEACLGAGGIIPDGGEGAHRHS